MPVISRRPRRYVIRGRYFLSPRTAGLSGRLALAPPDLLHFRYQLDSHILSGIRMTSFVMQNYLTGGDDPLSLDRIRSVLVRLEETIIFCPYLLSYSL